MCVNPPPVDYLVQPAHRVLFAEDVDPSVGQLLKHGAVAVVPVKVRTCLECYINLVKTSSICRLNFKNTFFAPFLVFFILPWGLWPQACVLGSGCLRKHRWQTSNTHVDYVMWCKSERPLSAGIGAERAMFPNLLQLLSKLLGRRHSCLHVAHLWLCHGCFVNKWHR